jgi:hypothetical protein
MHDEPRETTDIDADISGVVTGPIGSARLVEPTKAQAPKADLDTLPDIEIGDDVPGDAPQVPPE